MKDITSISREAINPKMIAALRMAGENEWADQLELKAKAGMAEIYLQKFITKYPSMLKLKEDVRKLALVDDCILIEGESGTGKELIARALHGDREGKFVAINCAGIPENLIESELFGHVAGAFTGAKHEKEGLLKTAENGSIFLDEIGDLQFGMQAKLLRAIQEGSVRKVGGTEEISINCRFLSATHRNLEQLKEKELFREDLFWRITTFVLRTTPIRQRTADIPLILKSLDRGNYIKNVDDFCKKIPEDSLTGNVRSLQQIYRRYVVLGIEPGKE